MLRFESVDSYAPEVAALVYGPIVLGLQQDDSFDGDRENPEEWIEPIQKDGYSFAFRTKPGHVKPYEHLTREFLSILRDSTDAVVITCTVVLQNDHGVCRKLYTQTLKKRLIG